MTAEEENEANSENACEGSGRIRRLKMRARQTNFLRVLVLSVVNEKVMSFEQAIRKEFIKFTGNLQTNV